MCWSPPVWYCWRVLPDCQSPSPMSCDSVRLYENIFNLNYTFTSVGTFCLEISVRNNISNLQTSYNIHVQDSRKYSTFFQNIFVCINRRDGELASTDCRHVVKQRENNWNLKPNCMLIYASDKFIFLHLLEIKPMTG